MKGVMMPEVSAGSNHVGASEMWAPQIISPAGASARPSGVAVRGVAPRITSAGTNNRAKRPRTSFMEASLWCRWLSFFELHILVGGREHVAGDQADARFLDPWAHAAEPGV